MSENEFLTIKEIMNDCKRGYFGRVEKKIERRRQKIISEFVKDLNDLEIWKEIPWDCYKQIDELKKKWKERK